jgi:hypothetical protein
MPMLVSLENLINKYKFYSPSEALLDSKNQEFLEPFVAPFKDAEKWGNISHTQGLNDGKGDYELGQSIKRNRIDAVEKLIGAYCKVMGIKDVPALETHYFEDSTTYAVLNRPSIGNIAIPFITPKILINRSFIVSDDHSAQTLHSIVHELGHLNQLHKRRNPLYALLSPVVKGWRRFAEPPTDVTLDPPSSDMKKYASHLTERDAENGAEMFLQVFKVPVPLDLYNQRKQIQDIAGDYYETETEIKLTEKNTRIASFKNIGESVRRSLFGARQSASTTNAVISPEIGRDDTEAR